jgi:OOP family OmpA-OmpF porin
MNNCYDAVVEYMLKNPNKCIVIIAHTDSIGSEQYNLKLSQCRADFIKKIFVRKGISSVRIQAIGKGESEPIADNGTAEGRRRNRRVEIIYEECDTILDKTEDIEFEQDDWE